MSDRGSLIERLTGVEVTADDPRAAQFVRGLALGALVGAAIAGSTIWQRRRTATPRPAAAEKSAADATATAAPPDSRG